MRHNHSYEHKSERVRLLCSSTQCQNDAEWEILLSGRYKVYLCDSCAVRWENKQRIRVN